MADFPVAPAGEQNAPGVTIIVDAVGVGVGVGVDIAVGVAVAIGVGVGVGLLIVEVVEFANELIDKLSEKALVG